MLYLRQDVGDLAGAEYHIKNTIKRSLPAGRYYREWAHCLRYSASQRLDCIGRLEISRHLHANAGLPDPYSQPNCGSADFLFCRDRMGRTFHHFGSVWAWCAAEPADSAASSDLENDDAGKSSSGATYKIVQSLTTAIIVERLAGPLWILPVSWAQPIHHSQPALARLFRQC